MKIQPASPRQVQTEEILLAESRVVLPFMLCSCITSSLTLPTNCPLSLGSLFDFFLRSTHEVLELGPEGFYRAELVSNLELLVKDTGGTIRKVNRTYCDDTLQVPIQTVDVLEYLFHALSQV